MLWCSLFDTAVVLVPEEAEQVIRTMYAKATHPKVHLMTYASPVTKRMMEFNDLVFFNMPPLPSGWVAPQWLKTELGLLAGRLYFQWHEYESLCKFLGVMEDEKNTGPLPFDSDDEEDMRASEDDIGKEDGQQGDKTIPSPRGKKQTITTSFSPRPLTFLQEWLAIRRHGQDFIHTPMGFITQGKALQTTHPFFGKGTVMSEPMAQVGAALAGTTAGGLGAGRSLGQNENGYVDEGAEFDGVDDMGANVGNVGDENGEEVVYDDSEWFNSDLSDSNRDSD